MKREKGGGDTMKELRKENDVVNETPNNENNQSKSQILENQKRAKSCKGCLYYSSTLKSNARNPLCVGITRSLPQEAEEEALKVYILGEAKAKASKEGRSMRNFKYGCIGYSVYSHGKELPANVQGSSTKLPACVGLEVLVDKGGRVPASVPAHAHNNEGAQAYPPNQTQKPANSMGDKFLNRFSRNATLVANGVVKNLCKVGNHIKDRVDDILYPYGRRPK